MLTWLTRRIANPLLCATLASPAHLLFSGALVKLSYRGRRSGRRRSLPVQYARRGSELVVIAGHASHKRWWRNFRHAAPVTVTLAGRSQPATAEIVSGRDRDDALTAYIARFPRASGEGDIEVLRIRFDSTAAGV